MASTQLFCIMHMHKWHMHLHNDIKDVELPTIKNLTKHLCIVLVVVLFNQVTERKYNMSYLLAIIAVTLVVCLLSIILVLAHKVDEEREKVSKLSKSMERSNI